MLPQQSAGEEGEQDNEVLDSLGIPGWDKVDSLASALLDLKGMCVSSSEAGKIKKLYEDLIDFDKQPLTYKPREPKLTRLGRRGRKKFHHSNHVTVDMVRRWVSPSPLLLLKSL